VSAAALERLAAARAFKPMEAFDELADNHVDFDELLGGKRREAALAKALQGTTPARVAVLGPSGSGKSSLIAATLADLPAFLPLSIAIGQADVGILDSQARFGQFIIRELLRQAKGRFAAQQKIGRRREAALARLAADTTTRTGPVGKLALNIGIPDYAAVSTEIRSAIKSTESDLNPSQSLEGLEEIAHVFSAPERPMPVLIIDDADKWAGSPVPGDEDSRAWRPSTTGAIAASVTFCESWTWRSETPQTTLQPPNDSLACTSDTPPTSSDSDHRPALPVLTVKDVRDNPRYHMLCNDHSHCLVGPMQSADALIQRLDSPPAQYVQLTFVIEAITKSALLSRALDRVADIPIETIDAAFAEMPATFVPSPQDARLMREHLLERRERLRGIFRAHRTTPYAGSTSRSAMSLPRSTAIRRRPSRPGLPANTAIRPSQPRIATRQSPQTTSRRLERRSGGCSLASCIPGDEPEADRAISVPCSNALSRRCFYPTASFASTSSRLRAAASRARLPTSRTPEPTRLSTSSSSH
jgi:hypothetical protein